MRIIIDLTTGVTLMIPVSLIQGLQTDDEKALADFELMAQGTQIHWETLDTQFYVESFLKGIFGTQKWMAGLNEHLAEIGRKGGLAKTPAKRSASAENGKKGGRPRKVQTA
jgi:general stress protein YciG